MNDVLTQGLLSTERPVAFYDLHNGQGTKLYNHNIQEVNVIEDANGGVEVTIDPEAATGTRFRYDSLRVEYPVCGDNIFRTLINAKYGTDKENKLRNEYESAELDLLDVSHKEPYIAFLRDRLSIQTMIDQDCEANNVPLSI